MEMDVEFWGKRLVELLREKRSRANDQELVALVYQPVDSSHSNFLPVLFSAYESNLDSSILQGFWNALGRASPDKYYIALAKMIANIYQINPDRAVELLHFPGLQPSKSDQIEYFRKFLSSLDDVEIANKLSNRIVQLQLINDQPWNTFCQILKERYGGE